MGAIVLFLKIKKHHVARLNEELRISVENFSSCAYNVIVNYPSMFSINGRTLAEITTSLILV